MGTLLALLLAGLQEPAPDEPPFRVPAGFTIERAAGPPLVDRPIMAAFDDRGRLYVSDSAGVNHKGPELLKNPPHSIRLLEDADGDGVFDRSRVFADKLVFPQGLLWHDGAVFTVSPPSLWKLEDTDGDGLCDRRTELVTGFANTGVADDVHGSCLGPDGRIYFLPGRMNHNLRTAGGGPIRRATGPWVMRCRPDGRDVEILSGCVGNPVELDFTPEGDFFVSGTFWAPDSFGGGLRDALIHGVEGGEYAVRDRVYKDRKRTGDFLPVLVPMEATAPSGLTLYRSGAFGPEYRGNLFCTYFNTRKVLRHVLSREGATFRSRDEDFAIPARADAHPTDILEDADGSLLIVDTGGWFLIGCPTSKISKPQVLGGIYRVRKKDAPRETDPRGLSGGRGLADPRFAVRERAMAETARRGETDLPALRDALPEVRKTALWTLARIDGAAARAAARNALSDGDAGVRQAAAFGAGLHRDGDAEGRLREMVLKDEPPVRREAATALGRIGRAETVPALLESLRMAADRFLDHAIIYALIRIGDREATRLGLSDPSAEVRRGALIALDQMEGGNLEAAQVVPMLDPINPALQQAAVRILTSRPAWAKEVGALCREWLEAPSDNLRGILLAFSGDAGIQDLVAAAMRREGTPSATRLLLLEIMARAPLERIPATWSAEARWSLDHPDERVVRQAVSVLRGAAAGDFDPAIFRLARDASRPEDLRVEALAAALPRAEKVERADFSLLVSCLKGEKPPLLRRLAAETLSRSALDDPLLGSLVAAVEAAGPLELARLVSAFERSTKPELGRRLLAALEKCVATPGLPPETLRRALKGYPAEVRTAAEPLFKKLETDLDQQKAKMAELEPATAGGDRRRGREVFLGPRAGCTACHAVKGQGGRVGPDLSKIGAIRSRRDLLEAVVFPSASFARGYEPVVLKTRDGAIVDGLLARETAEAIVLFTSERVEKTIPRAEVEELREGRLSVMPQGLDGALSRGELSDLLAFLASLK